MCGLFICASFSPVKAESSDDLLGNIFSGMNRAAGDSSPQQEESSPNLKRYSTVTLDPLGKYKLLCRTSNHGVDQSVMSVSMTVKVEYLPDLGSDVSICQHAIRIYDSLSGDAPRGAAVELPHRRAEGLRAASQSSDVRAQRPLPAAGEEEYVDDARHLSEEQPAAVSI